jgi:eukaryotic-like serine/threonine-protein kinase
MSVPSGVAKEVEDAIFETALGLDDDAARRELLRRTFQGDPDGLVRMERLLASARASTAFFVEAREHRTVVAGEVLDELPVSFHVPSPRPTVPTEGPGSRIGPYRLIERIGEGGCGVVYEAEQEEPVRRRVALKIIRLGMDTEGVIARFEVERQALALMDHPNIARVLDAGATATGRPYFIMELVGGERITSFCDAARLDTRQRLALFIQVCNAIQHAHQKGIIHRDLKPSNILIAQHDGVAVPKVIDFGIAKAADGRRSGKTQITASDQFIGTPAYMSPEQVDLGGIDIDTRSDVYSLGVVLYELLTGRTPFDGEALVKSGAVEMRKTLLECEPPPPARRLASTSGAELTSIAARRHAEPRQLVSLLRGDLDWIVMKAMSKDRNRRYQTVNGLAADVQRFLDHQPVVARKPGTRYLLGKFIQRNRLACLAGLLIGVSVLGGLGVSTWLYLRERAALKEQARLRSLAEVAQVEESRLRQQAQARESVSQAAVLLSMGKLEEADAQLRLHPLTSIEPSREATEVFRALGDWNAIYGRWPEAAQCFVLLVQANRFVPVEEISKTLDLGRPGLALLESGDVAGYERMRRDLIERFASNSTDHVLQQLFIISLLRPADRSILQSLEPHAASMAKSVLETPGILRPWQLLDLVLYEYRQGHFLKSLEWADLFFADKTPIRADRHASVHCIAAMAAQRLGNVERARAELTAVRELVASHPESDPKSRNNEWWDWAYVRNFLREAEGVVGHDQGVSPR